MDFTLQKYYKLLVAQKKNNYQFITFNTYLADISKFNLPIADQKPKIVILRHDADMLPENSLVTAKIENELGIKGTYYFRIVPESFDEKIIKEIAEMGHEIGYHYEELDTAYRQLKIQNSKFKIGKSKEVSKQSALGNKQKENQERDSGSESGMTTDNQPPTSVIDLAYEMFGKNLEKIRNVVPVSTICMHGSPLSPFDNKMIWTKYDYKKLGIIGEPYFDINWDEFGYLTDTGRRWNGSDVSVRDKVNSHQSSVYSLQSTVGNKQTSTNDKFSMFKDHLKSTQDIINALEQDKLPDKLMITVHPQRWSDNYLARGKELVLQNLKNVVKRFIVRRENIDA